MILRFNLSAAGKRRGAGCAGLFVACLCPGLACRPAHLPAHPAPESSRAEVSAKDGSRERDFPLTGVVRSIDRPRGTVEIRHEAIPGFMPAMTMPFRVKDPGELDAVRPGDEVEATLHVGENESALSDLVVTRPVSMTLEVSGNGAELKPKPAVLEPGEPVPDFEMTTQDGKRMRLSDLKGKVVVLTFIYTRCPLPEFCPLMDRKFAQLASKLGAVRSWGEQVRLLSVSFDPEHDTPEVLSRHAKRQGASPPLWTFAVARHAELQKVAPALGLMYGPEGNEVVHSLSTAIIDQEGRLFRLETGKKWEPAEFFRQIVALLPRTRK